MVKAIVRINAFLDEKQMKITYNLIYDQLKAGFEIITVPSYCDVYIIDGGDIEIQKDAKIETASEKKECSNCKYDEKRAIEQPCRYCCHNIIDGRGTDKWEAKDE